VPDFIQRSQEDRRRGTHLTEQNETQTNSPGGRLMEGNRFLDPEDHVSLRELALVPWKHKYVVAGCTIACALAAIFFCVAMKRG
jgi:hypothetical protein